jgi:CysZ protein
MNSLITPLARALSQLGDSTFRGVLLRSVLWSALAFTALHAATIWAIHQMLGLQGWLAWAADVLGFIGASLIALWLFLPVAAAIGTLYLERVALAVERRFYPWLPHPQGAPMIDQALDGIVVGLRVLGFSVLGLALALLLPGVGLLLGWAVGAYGIGRGLFVTVAMRRMSRAEAEYVYRANRGLVLAQGGAMAAAAYIPLVNLLIPVLGTAAMVHVLDLIMPRPPAAAVR